MSVNESNGLRNFGRKKVDLMLELIELGRNNKKFGFSRTEELLKFKGFLLTYREMVWGDNKVRLSKDFSRNNI